MTRKQPPPLVYPGAKQRDMVAESPKNCPTCGREWRAAKRVCRRCGQPISNSHKWVMIPAGPGLWAIEHRCCESPERYALEETNE
jgi:predicted amidophosphoribosyltransferase